MSFTPRPPTEPHPVQAEKLTQLCDEISDISVAQLREMASKLNLPIKSNASKQVLCDMISSHIGMHNIGVRNAADTDELDDLDWLLDPITYHWLVTAVAASDGRLYNAGTFSDIMTGRTKSNKAGISPFTNEKLKPFAPPCLPVRGFVLQLLAKKGIEEVAEAYETVEHEMTEELIDLDEGQNNNEEYQRIVENYQTKRVYPDRAGFFDLSHKHVVVKPLRDENPLLYDLVHYPHVTVYRGIVGAHAVTELAHGAKPFLFAWIGKDNTANVGVHLAGGTVAFARYTRNGRQIELVQSIGTLKFDSVAAFIQHALA